MKLIINDKPTWRDRWLFTITISATYLWTFILRCRLRPLEKQLCRYFELLYRNLDINISWFGQTNDVIISHIAVSLLWHNVFFFKWPWLKFYVHVIESHLLLVKERQIHKLSVIDSKSQRLFRISCFSFPFLHDSCVRDDSMYFYPSIVRKFK